MGILFWILAAICLIVGVVWLIEGSLLWGIVLIVVGIVLAAAGGGVGRRTTRL